MVTHTLSSASTPLRLVLGEASAVGRPIGRAQAEEALAHQALHDPLTTRPNRALLHDRLRQAILAARRDGSSLSFLLMDLDRFKEINAAFGHACGDVLLQMSDERADRRRRCDDPPGAVEHHGHAYRVAQDEPPDLALLDPMMPGLDGWEVLCQPKGDALTVGGTWPRDGSHADRRRGAA